MHNGVDRTAAIIDAGQKRARPIVMTTIAMAAGMVPSALAFGASGEFRSPMAIAVIAGLIASTFLSLIFVPAAFTIVDDIGRLSWSLFARFVTGEDKPAAPPPCHASKVGPGAEPGDVGGEPLAPVYTGSPLLRRFSSLLAARGTKA
jgi:hypothetical protein